MKEILRALEIQRWDDHRYYHHSRINQSLHLLSASSFLCAYALIFWAPWVAGLVGWLVSMTSRQVGHFSLIRFGKLGATNRAVSNREVRTA